MDSNFLCLIPIYQLGNNWQGVKVSAIDDEKFEMMNPFSLYRERLVFVDEELTPDKNGKVIIDITPLKLNPEYNNCKTPKTFEMPAEILAARKEKRRLKALAENAVFIDGTKKPRMYFFIENGKLRVLQGEREALAEKIELIHKKQAVNAESLDLGHPYLELPAEVAQKYEKVLLEKRLQKLTLIKSGKSLLNGLDYYRLNMEITAHMWEMVKTYFEDFGTETDMSGFLTCQPVRVAEILGIPKK